MSEQDTGGPAFPSGDGKHAGGHGHQYGMSLRDWMAGQALVGLALQPDEFHLREEGETLDDGLRRVWAVYAKAAYIAADAMLAARKTETM